MRAVPALIAVALPFVVTPGASFTLTLAHATRSQSNSWRRIALGTAAGIVLLALAVGATGLGAALSAVPVIRVTLGLVGTTVLIAFGVVVLVKAIRPASGAAEESAPANLVRWSFAAVVTNPKALSLYAIVVPTLAGPELHGFALFGSFAVVHIALLTAWLCITHYSVTRIPGLARSPRLQRGLFVAAGVAMIGLGCFTAAQTLAER